MRHRSRASPVEKTTFDFTSIQEKQKEALRLSLSTPVLFFGGAKGGGKATDLDALLYTPQGSKRMGDIRIGDNVACPDGSYSPVIAIYPQGKQDLYRVTFIDGASVLCTLDHLWLAHVVGRTNKRSEHNSIYTTRELIGLLDKRSRSKSTIKPNVTIPLTLPVEFTRPKKYAFPVDPYVLGFLLGDGCLVGRNITFTTDDPACALEIAKYYPISKYADKYTYGIKDRAVLKGKLNKLSLYKKGSKDKFIPERYRYASIVDRFSLIQGLFDSDGYCDDRGHVEYTSISQELAYGVQWIVRSLGYKATLSIKRGSYGGKQCELVYRLYIQGSGLERLFRLERKRNRVKQYNNGLGEVGRRLISIEFEKKAEAQCITLRHPAGLYVTNDFIVTHNSWLVRCREISRRLKYPGTQGLIVRRTYPELRANHIVKMFQEYPVLQSWYNKAEKTIYYPNGSTTEFSYLKNTDDIWTYQGREYQDISVDEITQHEEVVFKTLRSSLRTSQSGIKPTVFLTGNPGGIGHAWIKRIFIDRQFREGENPTDFAFVQAFVTDNKALMDADPEYVKRLEDLPEHLRKAYLEGDWNIFAGQMFTMLTPSKHIIDPIKLPTGTQYFAGYDYGYNHPFAFVLCALTPAGEYYVVSHIRERFVEVADQAQLMLKMLDGKGKVIIYSGHDIFNKESGKTIVDQLLDAGFARSGHSIVRAAIDHVNGVAELRKAFSLNPAGVPYLRFFRNTQPVYDCIAEQQIDPDKPEDVIKLNAVDGEGGDDLYDALRYAIRSWTLPNKLPKSSKPGTGEMLLQKRLELARAKQGSWR